MLLELIFIILFRFIDIGQIKQEHSGKRADVSKSLIPLLNSTSHENFN